MKPTTTPNGATLMWLEEGDTLAANDLYETSRIQPWIVGASDSFLQVGETLTEARAQAYRPRRYIPLPE